MIPSEVMLGQYLPGYILVIPRYLVSLLEDAKLKDTNACMLSPANGVVVQSVLESINMRKV